MPEEVRLHAAAAAIYRACFTAAPIDFEEAARRETIHYQRAIEAAQQVRRELEQCAA
jgi:hypothetical protein